MTPEQLAKSGTEHAQQRALFAWANMAAKYGVEAASNEACYSIKDYASTNYNGNRAIPELRWLHAIHNQGHGDAAHGAKAKAEGVTTGIWDIFLPVTNARSYFECAGLYIEMKVGKNALSKPQEAFEAFANGQGYRCVVCWTWQNARDEILKYLGLV